LKRRTLPKPLANATSVTGSAVSVSRRFASSSLCVWANSTGDTPNSAPKARRKCRSVMPRRAARESSPDWSSVASSIMLAAAWARRVVASTLALPGASSGRQRRHGR
jgi:hypothetical protein